MAADYEQLPDTVLIDDVAYSLNPSEAHGYKYLYMPAPDSMVDAAFLKECEDCDFCNTGKWLLVSCHLPVGLSDMSFVCHVT
jgi:hypothetical protein